MTWKQICADPVLAELPYKIESDEWGNIVMSPPPGMGHSYSQTRIVLLLNQLLTGGMGLTEFPVQTAKGVKGVDAVWISDERRSRQPIEEDVAITAPEICVEVISPSNSRGEIEEKKTLYFQSGASECWTCDQKGKMSFFNPVGPLAHSELCPDFPVEV